jgi:hypothetical protein
MTSFRQSQEHKCNNQQGKETKLKEGEGGEKIPHLLTKEYG